MDINLSTDPEVRHQQKIRYLGLLYGAGPQTIQSIMKQKSKKAKAAAPPSKQVEAARRRRQTVRKSRMSGKTMVRPPSGADPHKPLAEYLHRSLLRDGSTIEHPHYSDQSAAAERMSIRKDPPALIAEALQAKEGAEFPGKILNTIDLQGTETGPVPATAPTKLQDAMADATRAYGDRLRELVTRHMITVWESLG